MKRILLSAAALALFTAPAFASAGFSCDADDKNVAKLAIGGAAPRSEPGLINFGAELEITAGKKAIFGLRDLKDHSWDKDELKLHILRGKGADAVEIRVDAKPNPDEEGEYLGTYTVRAGALVRSGKIKCAGE